MDQKTTATQTNWPTPQEYNEAVQNLHVTSSDDELQLGKAELSKLGIPKPITGAFASVYKIECKKRDWALRCFLRQIPNVQWRYECISDFVMTDDLSYTVGFDFQPKGIKVQGLWYPVVKMEWIEGETLDNYIYKRRGRITEDWIQRFTTMCAKLKEAGIAHGDLQHGNIIVRDEELLLVDYDGMYVPSMAGSLSNELGHRNYQSPLRTAHHFGPYLDAFSSWVIYCSLKALLVDPKLYDRLGAGEDCLLFTQSDFQNPLNSCAFNVLENHSDAEVSQLAKFLRWCLQVDPEQIPPLGSDFSGERYLLEIPNSAPTSRQQQQAIAIVSARRQLSGAQFRPSGSQPVAKAASYKIEAELLRPRPRSVEITYLNQFRYLSYWKQRLLMQGTAVEAMIIDVDRSRGILTYEYYDISRERKQVGRMKVGKTKVMRVDIGDTLTALYHASTDRSLLYKFSDFKVLADRSTQTQPTPPPPVRTLAPPATGPSKPNTTGQAPAQFTASQVPLDEALQQMRQAIAGLNTQLKIAPVQVKQAPPTLIVDPPEATPPSLPVVQPKAIPSIELELCGKRPRSVEARGDRNKAEAEVILIPLLGFYFGIAALILKQPWVGVPMLTFCFLAFYAAVRSGKLNFDEMNKFPEYHLCRYGLTTQGTIVELFSTVYPRVAYVYEYAGVAYKSYMDITPSQFADASVGDKVTVVFNTWTPSVSMIYKYSYYKAV